MKNQIGIKRADSLYQMSTISAQSQQPLIPKLNDQRPWHRQIKYLAHDEDMTLNLATGSVIITRVHDKYWIPKCSKKLLTYAEAVGLLMIIAQL